MAVTAEPEWLDRTDAGYDAARRATMWNAFVPDRYPEAVVLAATVEDVVAAVRRAKREGWAVGVRSGGHSWAGNHVRDGGLLLDLSGLDECRVDVAARTAVVGPGKSGHLLAAELGRVGLSFPVGHCEGVCLGGYLLQGGFGWNGRALGMGCENVVAIDYVDADGELRHASEDEDPEMLWAARGAGPGFFGVVVRFHLRLHPRAGFAGMAGAVYPLDRLDDVFAWADTIGADVPASVELDLLASRHAWPLRRPGIQVMAAVFADDWRAARRDTAFLRTRPRGARLAMRTLPATMPQMYRRAMTHYPSSTRWAVDNVWTHASYDDLRPGIHALVDDLPGAPSHLLWMNWTPPESRPDMAFSVEDRTYIAAYAGWRDAAQDDRHVSWVTDGMARLAEHSTGVQLADENLGRRPASFVTDEALRRLDRLRAERDPDSRFYEWMGRPWI
ncbi:MAG TPA: FAD-binding oxidoreductase [Marmoricola sp.]